MATLLSNGAPWGSESEMQRRRGLVKLRWAGVGFPGIWPSALGLEWAWGERPVPDSCDDAGWLHYNPDAIDRLLHVAGEFIQNRLGRSNDRKQEPAPVQKKRSWGL
jgi:hypothetical protein